ncbi:hypothetical protein [Crassaminicella profunda]|uniref:hypothetical protein n=1 Tax=Crassaminicella profunda TaxID=1286698 RepID=UPI001CA6EED0|nr:hypothetical protein [Crassaminicella profunda]QZY56918.1 hypothetical protein K7H06_08365 [Crassaminicella profunda]
MKKKNSNNQIGAIVIIVICSVAMLLQYFVIYNISEQNIEKYLTKKIKSDVGISKLEIRLIDDIKTKYGLVVLFKTDIQEKPIGYAVFEKDGLLDRYFNEDFVLYDDSDSYIKDSDALIDLKNQTVFQFANNEIKILNSKSSNKELIKYYSCIVLVIVGVIYGVFKLLISSKKK